VGEEQFIGFSFQLRAVDVPDWDLIGQVFDLLRPYGSPPDFRIFVSARDRRGEYAESTPAELRANAATRREAPERITVQADGVAGGVRQLLRVQTSLTDSEFWLASPDEWIVNHVEARVRRMLEQAAARHQASPGGTAEEPKPTPAGPQAEPSVRRGWWHQPSPWVLLIVATIIATVVAGIILAVFELAPLTP
jgi:hypothetical protein